MKLGYMKRVLCSITAALLSVCAAGDLQAQQPAAKMVRVAAAADLQPVMPALAAAYEHETGVKLQVSFGSSGTLSTQIINGAPFDVFLGADFTFPETIVAAGLADEKAPVPYAEGTLVLWTRKDFPMKSVTVDSLTDPRITHIAIADEFHAPYGRAAAATLRQMKLYEKVKDKLVTAENVSQTAQFIESGNAQTGFISLTLASSPHMKEVGSFTRVPKIYPKIRQCGVVMKASPNLEDARRFLAWMTSPKVQERLPNFGLDPAQ